MVNATISVIIPVYNAGIYLRECIDSVLNQSFKDFEVVVVIDASPDNSLEIALDYQKKDDRIIIINKEVNEGLSAARNSGVSAASGDYIIHLDSDDFWIDDNMLRDLHDILEIDGCDMLTFNGYNYEDDEFRSLMANKINMVNGCFNEESALWDYRAIYLYVFRREFIDRNHLSFIDGITVGEDGIFVASALVKAERISSTSKCYYAYRRTNSSMMNMRWSLDRFIEEETSSQIISDMISINSTALDAYLMYRFSIYWISKIAVKAKCELTKNERLKLYALVRDNFIKIDVALLNGRGINRKLVKRLYGYFIVSDFDKLDTYIDKVNCLKFTSSLSVECVLGLLLKNAEKIYTYSSWLLKKFKRCIKNSLIIEFNWRLRNSKYKEKQFVNAETLDEFNFCLSNKERAAGVSAMLRVKNEERRIQSCLESIIDAFDEVVVIDNASSDSTIDIVNKLMSSEKYAEKIKLFTYPHAIARCGQEHSLTDESSVHSLAYYYNWCLSKCSYSMVCKWDADMVLSTSAEMRARFKRYLHDCVYKKVWVFGRFSVRTVYVDGEGDSFFSNDEVNREIRVFPNSPFVYFMKAEQWEALISELNIQNYCLEDICAYEVKDIADDEFSHWTDLRFKKDRKVREYRNYMRVKNGWHKTNELEFIPAREL